MKTSELKLFQTFFSKNLKKSNKNKKKTQWNLVTLELIQFNELLLLQFVIFFQFLEIKVKKLSFSNPWREFLALYPQTPTKLSILSSLIFFRSHKKKT